MHENYMGPNYANYFSINADSTFSYHYISCFGSRYGRGKIQSMGKNKYQLIYQNPHLNPIYETELIQFTKKEKKRSRSSRS